MNWRASVFLILTIGLCVRAEVDLENDEESRQQTTEIPSSSTIEPTIPTIVITTPGGTASTTTPETSNPTTTTGVTVTSETSTNPSTITGGSTSTIPQETTTTSVSISTGSASTVTSEITTSPNTITEGPTSTSPQEITTTTGTNTPEITTTSVSPSITEISTTTTETSEATSTINPTTTTSPPGNSDQQCRDRYRFMNRANITSYTPARANPCRIYCRISFPRFNITRSFPAADMTSCGNNMVCRVGSCVNGPDQSELARCQNMYPGRNVTALPGTGFSSCRITCRPTRRAGRLFWPFGRGRTFRRTDGTPCRRWSIFGRGRNGTCRNGRCRT